MFACVSDGSKGDNSVNNTVINRYLESPDETVSEPADHARRDIAVKVNDLIGINAFEWDFLQNPDDANQIDEIYEPHMPLIKTFRSVRHFLDWENMEQEEGKYTFNPAARGSWNYDLVYSRSKAEGIEVVPCIKDITPWLLKTYPTEEQDIENTPIAYRANREDPASYIALGRFAFQFAARYGSNKDIDSALVSVDSRQRWTEDPLNQVKIGLDLINYIECNNEPDKWWVGRYAEQSGREYAANLSAFYDGHQGRLGKNVGVKNADPNMKVVMGGLARADIQFVKDMVEWCRENRGLKSDGSVDLCFDVLNFHMYSNDNMDWLAPNASRTQRGKFPESTAMSAIAEEWTEYAETIGNMPVWTTETGYDLGEESVQRAIPIGTKSARVTQADWILRTALLLARHGVERVFFYQLFDANDPYDPDVDGDSPFARSGLMDEDGPRPSAYYLRQFGRLMGDYQYRETLHYNPVVDRYELNNKSMYVLCVPDEKGREASYELDLKGAQKAIVRYFNPNGNEMIKEELPTDNGKITIRVTETPAIVEAG